MAMLVGAGSTSAMLAAATERSVRKLVPSPRADITTMPLPMLISSTVPDAGDIENLIQRLVKGSRHAPYSRHMADYFPPQTIATETAEGSFSRQSETSGTPAVPGKSRTPNAVDDVKYLHCYHE
jgi:hypothetical protein